MEKQEALEVIREMLNHRGWEIFKGLSQRWRQQKNREQADILRQCNLEASRRVILIQGEIDGSLYTENLLEEYRKQLTSATGEENPAY
mgnify:CR=1 FL=1